MDPFTVYKTYLGIKSHFNNPNYNYSTYGNVKAKYETFLNRNDRYFFQKISKKYRDDEIVNFFVANFLMNENVWVGELLTSETEEVYTEWKRRNESIEYIFEQDISKLCEEIENKNLKFENLFDCENKHPDIFKMLLQNKISPESYIILDKILKFNDFFSKKLSKDISFVTMSRRYKKYSNFVKIDNVDSYSTKLRNKIQEYALI